MWSVSKVELNMNYVRIIVVIKYVIKWLSIVYFAFLPVLKKVKHRMVENMNSSTADALGLSRAILCNGTSFL